MIKNRLYFYKISGLDFGFGLGVSLKSGWKDVDFGGEVLKFLSMKIKFRTIKFRTIKLLIELKYIRNSFFGFVIVKVRMFYRFKKRQVS